MRFRIWPLVGISFFVLLCLVPLFVWLVARKAVQIDARTKDARHTYQMADDAITDIGTNIYRAALISRDVPKTGEATAQRQLASIRAATEGELNVLRNSLDSTQHAQLQALRLGLNQFLQSPDDAGRQLQEMLVLAQKIDSLNEANLSLEEAEIVGQQHALREFAAGITGLLLLLALTIAIATTVYLSKLERISHKEKTRAENAEYELRRLSNQLVRVQEDERRTISRELHDEIGQLLTGLRMELGGLTRGDSDGRFRERLESVKHLTEDALRSVRNLSLLLRPSMLDDFGLEPALRWQAKEFLRRSGTAVAVQIEGNLDNLPETVRICIYRAVQEALTNCSKHADASRVTVTVRQEEDQISVSVQDNGRGFDPGHLLTKGIGLIGMEERVRALQGRLSISSEPGKGTIVTLTLPALPEQTANV